MLEIFKVKRKLYKGMGKIKPTKLGKSTPSLTCTEKMLKEEGEEKPAEIMAIVLDSWKSIVDKSETPWALCEECYESIKNFKSKS